MPLPFAESTDAQSSNAGNFTPSSPQNHYTNLSVLWLFKMLRSVDKLLLELCRLFWADIVQSATVVLCSIIFALLYLGCQLSGAINTLQVHPSTMPICEAYGYFTGAPAWSSFASAQVARSRLLRRNDFYHPCTFNWYGSQVRLYAAVCQVQRPDAANTGLA
jgi:hypothetical protein